MLFRPPYGSFNAVTLAQLRQLHLLMVLWSVDTGDYLQPGVEAIVQHALAGAQPGAIILMHDGGGNRSETIAALPAIIKGLRERGLQPVTVPRADARRPAARRTAAAAEPERRLDGRRGSPGAAGGAPQDDPAPAAHRDRPDRRGRARRGCDRDRSERLLEVSATRSLLGERLLAPAALLARRLLSYDRRRARAPPRRALPARSRRRS